MFYFQSRKSEFQSATKLAPNRKCNAKKIYKKYWIYFQLSKERERLEAMMVHLHMKPPGKDGKMKDHKDEKDPPSQEKKTPASNAVPPSGAPLKSRSPPSGPPPLTSQNNNTSTAPQHTQNTVSPHVCHSKINLKTLVIVIQMYLSVVVCKGIHSLSFEQLSKEQL